MKKLPQSSTTEIPVVSLFRLFFPSPRPTGKDTNEFEYSLDNLVTGSKSSKWPSSIGRNRGPRLKSVLAVNVNGISRKCGKNHELLALGCVETTCSLAKTRVLTGRLATAIPKPKSCRQASKVRKELQWSKEKQLQQQQQYNNQKGVHFLLGAHFSTLLLLMSFHFQCFRKRKMVFHLETSEIFGPVTLVIDRRNPRTTRLEEFVSLETFFPGGGGINF